MTTPSLTPGFTLRAATAADADAIRYVHVASLWGLSAAAYGPHVIDSIVRGYPTVDMGLITAGTYYVIEAGGEIAACAGWTQAGTHGKQPGEIFDRDGRPGRPELPRDSMLVRAMFVHPKWTRRGLGSRLLERVESDGVRAGCASSSLFATVTGVPLYEAAGYRAVAHWGVRLPDGNSFASVQMEKPLALTAAA